MAFTVSNGPYGGSISSALTLVSALSFSQPVLVTAVGLGMSNGVTTTGQTVQMYVLASAGINTTPSNTALGTSGLLTNQTLPANPSFASYNLVTPVSCAANTYYYFGGYCSTNAGTATPTASQTVGGVTVTTNTSNYPSYYTNGNSTTMTSTLSPSAPALIQVTFLAGGQQITMVI